ncbi:hypothetical protein QAD02_016596 [Eretmocerus hayati]|uniref:Uncharacterized protein n=1 Tax=Eretmocerus hayati TaxID=131215 RepID=A0ACC2PE17_9HYME|nr:hypothetical protein QAD02_016596 [Eretmocerus hayati]
MAERKGTILLQSLDSVYHWNLDTHISAPNGKSWNSPSFWTTSDEWCLQFRDSRLYDGSENVGPVKLSILYLGDSEEEGPTLTIKFRVCTRGEHTDDEQVVNHYDDMDEIGHTQTFSEKRVYSIDLLNFPTKNYKLEIWCRIVTPSSFSRKDQNSHSSRHNFSLKNDYEQLLNSGKFSDVTFIVGNQELHLHKNILSSRSTVFAAMFDHDLEENNFEVVDIEDQTYEVMTEFFRYVYSARVNELTKYAIELLKTSNKYAVEELKSLCEQNLMQNIKIDNALELLTLADCYDAKNLQARCVHFIVSNAKKIIELPTFDINQVTADLRNELFKSVVRKA